MWLLLTRAKKRTQAILIVVLLLALISVAPILPPFYLDLLCLVLIFAILGMSLDILMGYTGLDSLGHAAFFGLAAYAVGIAMVRYDWGWGTAIVFALLLVIVLATLSGFLVVRVKGLFFVVLTLAISQVLWGSSHRWGGLTGGYNGIPGITRPFLTFLSNDIAFYYVVLILFLVCGFFMFRLIRSPFGLTLQGIRDSESRMKISGYNTNLHKHLAFIISGLFAGIAGILNVFYTGFVSPSDLSLGKSFDAMLIVYVGGPGTLVGSIIGSALIVTLRNYLSILMDRWMMVYGLVFILTVMFAPRGIVGWIRPRKQQTPAAMDPEDRRPPSFIGHHTQPIKTSRKSSNRVEVLRLEHLTKSYKGLLALNDVSLTVYSGSRMGIIGPNGAGKTTLFNLISGVYPPSSGKIVLLGKDTTKLAPHRRVGLGLARTYQVTNLYPTLTVMDNIRLGIMGIQKSKYLLHLPVANIGRVNERVRELLDFLDLWDIRNIEVRHLSYGHQRQLEVIMALASKPKVLLLDEPTAGLSQAELGPMVKLVKSLDPEMTILIIEHDMGVAFEIADEITVLSSGQILAKGFPEEIRANSSVRQLYLGSLA